MSPRNINLTEALLAPWVSEELPRIAFGTIIPIKHPMIIPAASPQIGESSFLVKSTIIVPRNVAMNVPSKSEYVLP